MYFIHILELPPHGGALCPRTPCAPISARGLLAHERVCHSASPPSFFTSQLVLHLTHSPHLTSSLIFLQFIYINLHDFKVVLGGQCSWKCGPKNQSFSRPFLDPLFECFRTILGSVLGTIFAQKPSRGSPFATPFSIPILISFWITFGSCFGCVSAPVLDLFFIILANALKPKN